MNVAPWSRERFRSVRGLRERSERVAAGLQVLEGPRLVSEALSRGLVSEVLLREGGPEDEWRRRAGSVPLTIIPAMDFERLCDTRTPQDVIAIGPLTPELPVAEVLQRCARVLYFDAVQDPGNCGALMRTACALGVEGALFGPGCADASAPRVLRAAAGASLRLLQGRCTAEELFVATQASAHTLLIPVVKDGRDALAMSAPERFVLVAGNEGQGSSLTSASAVHISIPMAAEVESLNVAAATAVILGRWWQRPQR